MNAVNSSVGTLLYRAARCTEAQPALVGFALASYRQRHGLQEGDLARFLECSTMRVNALALCRRPVLGDPAFDQAVKALAAYVGCSSRRLHALLGEQIAP